MSGIIFLNYRREDDPGFAGRLYDNLKGGFSADQLFMDVDNIPAGRNFVQFLDEKVKACDVLLAIVGRHWLDAKDADGKRRIDNAKDFVRIEIESALDAGKIVIPVLAHGAKMPPQELLPESMARFSELNAVAVTHERFGSDFRVLQQAVRRALLEADLNRARRPQIRNAGRIAEEFRVKAPASESLLRPNALVQNLANQQGPSSSNQNADTPISTLPRSQKDPRRERDNGSREENLATSLGIARAKGSQGNLGHGEDFLPAHAGKKTVTTAPMKPNEGRLPHKEHMMAGESPLLSSTSTRLLLLHVGSGPLYFFGIYIVTQLYPEFWTLPGYIIFTYVSLLTFGPFAYLTSRQLSRMSGLVENERAAAVLGVYSHFYCAVFGLVTAIPYSVFGNEQAMMTFLLILTVFTIAFGFVEFTRYHQSLFSSLAHAAACGSMATVGVVLLHDILPTASRPETVFNVLLLLTLPLILSLFATIYWAKRK